MKAFQAYHKPSGKYLQEKTELFGSWNRKKGPKKFYSRACDAAGALSNVMCDRKHWNRDEWEIHEMEFHVVSRKPLRKDENE